jgi:hypothetical protein
MTTKPRCMVAGCANVSFRKGLCTTHYAKFAPHKRTVRVCETPDCGAKHYGKGLCRKHYDLTFMRSPTAVKSAPPPKPAIRMVCPSCGEAALEVRDSRPTQANTIRRRRYCSACGSRFTTFEAFANAIPSRVNYAPAIKALEGVLSVLSALAETKPESEDAEP